ncbi:hypothetical protein DWB88_13865 (plasmid) [Staphylococcus warneri]|nr:hypothetical protein DWB88_13865 [Staphylococcus warneri]
MNEKVADIISLEWRIQDIVESTPSLVKKEHKEESEKDLCFISLINFASRYSIPLGKAFIDVKFRNAITNPSS